MNAMQQPFLNDALKRFIAVLKVVRTWHHHELYGAEYIPTTGPAILAFNHSLATYDAFLLGLGIFEKTGRLPQALGDNRIFQIPYLREFAHEIGFVPASPETAQNLLAAGHLVYVAPGGMREALRPSSQRYSVLWAKRKGFIRLSIKTGAPIVLAACPSADQIFHIYNNPLTKLAYNYLKFPVPLFRGWGLSFLPRPVKLIHRIAPPLFPPSAEDNNESVVETFHAQVIESMNALMNQARGEEA